MANTSLDLYLEPDEQDSIPGIVIHGRWEEPRRPVITAFIWGGKVPPVPMLPYGRATAA